jgi:hypothetical protein
MKGNRINGGERWPLNRIEKQPKNGTGKTGIERISRGFLSVKKLEEKNPLRNSAPGTPSIIHSQAERSLAPITALNAARNVDRKAIITVDTTSHLMLCGSVRPVMALSIGSANSVYVRSS